MKKIIKYNLFNINEDNTTPDIDSILDKIGSDGMHSLTDEDITTLDNYGKSDKELFNNKDIVIRDIQNMVRSTVDKIINIDSFGEDYIINRTEETISYLTELEIASVTVVKYSKGEDMDDYDIFDDEYQVEYNEFDIDTLVDIKLFLKTKYN